MRRFHEPRVTARRRRWQRVQELLTVGHWPARLAHLLGAQRPVGISRERFELRPVGTPRSLPVAFASDFHAGPCTHPLVLDSACRALAALEAPLLLLAGDFVCVSSRDIRELAPRLADIPAPLGKFAVLGNHDYWAGAAPVANALEAAGVRVLLNESVRLAPPYDEVWICGLDDPISGHPNPEAALEGASGQRIVLMHAPSGLGLLGGRRFELALCGHTHGGQLALPGGAPLFVPEGPDYRRFAQGRFQLDRERFLFVTRGVGYSTVPVRSFCPSEVVALELDCIPSHAPARAQQLPVRRASHPRELTRPL